MAVMKILHMPGTRQEQYEAILRDLDIVNRIPEGALAHIAGPVDDGWQVVAVWVSDEDFRRFWDGKLRAAMNKAGVQTPEVKTVQVHRMFGVGESDERRQKRAA